MIKTPLNILLAEDDKDYRFFFEQALKEIPIATHLTTVENGEELMKYLIEHALHLPDILFMDLSMHRKSGFECLHEIKENEVLKMLTVVVLTISLPKNLIYEQDMMEVLNIMGAQDYIRKPDDFELLKKAIHNTLNKTVEKNKLKMMNKKHLNILLADDDTDDCIFFKEALDELLIKTDLTTVHDGEQLMIYLDGTSRKLIDVLFLDINMPRKNGFECLAEIKQNENLKELPVIIFSTSYEHEVVNSLYESGAHYFIRKPSNFAQFNKIIYHTLLLIVQDEIAQPSRANFVLTMANNLMD